MSIRFATPADTEAVKDIWHKCFGDGDPFLSWNFSRNYNPDDTLVWVEKRKIVATLQMQSKNISLWGNAMPGNYIFGIATLPKYRGRGIAWALMIQAFRVAEERGQVVSLLIPFNYRFYEKFDYKMCYKLVKATIKREQSSPGDDYGHTIELREINDETIEILQNIYKKFCEPLNGWIMRSDREFRLILEDVLTNGNGHCVLCRDDMEGEYVGYALGRLENKKFSAYEMACIGSGGKYPIISGIFDMFADCHEIEVTSPTYYCDDLISTGGYLDYSKICPFAMAKVLNKEKFLRICGKNEFFCENNNYANMLFS
ncbi:MAG: GNAT family N-acetyltransferase [Oscillospiraceae bacterium]|nr:GNAT family N-acetyltransferase [Oscillospiraceae bacterium]